WLEASAQVMDRAIDQFWDQANGGFYFTAREHETLIWRTKDLFDNATPSGNSIAADVLLRLAVLLDRQDYKQKAEETIRVALDSIRQYSTGFGRMLCAVD